MALLDLPLFRMPVVQARVLCRASAPFAFDERGRPTVAAGMVLRGALGMALAKATCSPRGFAGSQCEKQRRCQFRDPCRYALWYKPGLSGTWEDIPPAFRLDHRGLTARLVQGEFVLPVAVWGERPVAELAGLLGAIGDMGAIGLDASTPDGLHPQTVRFEVAGVRAETPTTMAAIGSQAAQAWFGVRRATLVMQTATELPGAGLHPRIAGDLDPVGLLAAMAVRVGITEAALRSVGAERCVESAIHDAIGDLAERHPLRVDAINTVPVQLAQRSTRSGDRIVGGGLIGSLMLSGELGPWAPLFALAELCGLGRHTSYGLGHCQVLPAVPKAAVAQPQAALEVELRDRIVDLHTRTTELLHRYAAPIDLATSEGT